jgi:hypothetical protein
MRMSSKYKKVVQPVPETVCEPIKDWPEAERPREKLFQLGPERVEGLVQGYQKPLLGTLAVLEIGLANIRRECPHFREWLSRLEAWHV